MRLLSTFFAIVAGLATPTPQDGQGGAGANARATEAMQFLRLGPLTGGPGERPQIIDRLPEGFPRDLLPPDATPNVAAISPGLTVTVATLKAGVPFNHTTFAWTLDDAGWVTRTPGARGFVTAASGATIDVCRGQAFAVLQFGTGSEGNRLVRIRLREDSMRSCAPIGIRSFSDVPIPTLVLPEGVRTRGVGGGGGLDETSSRARLETMLTADALAAHFIPQFKDAGWTVEYGPAGDALMSVTRLIGATRTGEPITAQLILTGFPGLPFVDAIARYVRHKPVR